MMQELRHMSALLHDVTPIYNQYSVNQTYAYFTVTMFYQ